MSAIGTVHRQASANLLRIVDEGQTYYPETLFLALTYFRRALAQEIFKLRKKLCFWSSGGAIFFKLRVKFCFRSLGGAISGTEGGVGVRGKPRVLLLVVRYFKLREKFCFRSSGGAISRTEGWGGVGWGESTKTKSLILVQGS